MSESFGPQYPEEKPPLWATLLILAYFAVVTVDVYFQVVNGHRHWTCLHTDEGKAYMCLSTGDWGEDDPDDE